VSGWRSTVHTVALIAVGTASALVAQNSATVGGEVAVQDSAPTFDQLARRVLTLKVEVEWLRVRSEDRSSSVAGDGRTGWRPFAWTDSLDAMRVGLDMLAADARRLETAYQSARHARGVKVASELIALVAGARDSFDDLPQARNERSARIAITHLAAGLDALIQKIAEGEACCKAALR
jgi:hypothetical protein